MKAVILAAGCATRLRPYSDDTPKTLLPVAGVPILRRTITSLLRVGFDQFVIGTGYLEHMVRDAGSAMGESVGREWFSAATSQRLFSALHQRVTEQGSINEYYEAAFQQIVDEGCTLYGVDIGTMYATEIDTVEDLLAAEARLAQ